ncbi:unnamed protein product, partial [Effrenium voratum]
MSEGGRWLCNEQCFAGVLATTLTASAQLLAKVRETVKKHSIPEDQAKGGSGRMWGKHFLWLKRVYFKDDQTSPSGNPD